MSQQTNDDRAVVEPQRPASTRWTVFFILAVLTAAEFVVAVAVDANVPIIAVIAVAKAALIVYYFMHIGRLWQPLEDE